MTGRVRGDSWVRGKKGEDRKENIKTLLNFFPIIGEDSNGVMKRRKRGPS